jgi:2,5-dihydroxypyridine 5,6-dioxygenase
MPVYFDVADMHALFEAELRLCKLDASETLVLLVDRGSNPDYVEAAMASAQRIGAAVFQVVLPTLPSSEIPSKGAGPTTFARRLSEMPKVSQAIQCADMALDLTGAGFVHDPAQGEILRSGTRMLRVKQPTEALWRLFPTPELRQRVEAAAARLARAEHLRVTSPAGMDISAEIVPTQVGRQYGYTDTPGRWDSWPSGMVNCYPRDGSANGVIVLDRGDFLLPVYQYIREPVTIRVEGSFMTQIEGGFDAMLLREFLAGWGDRDAFFTSHMGWGLLTNGQWCALACVDPGELNASDGRSFEGNFLFSTGPNRYVGRHTPAHLDIPMRGCNVYLDDEPVVLDGKVVEDASRLPSPVGAARAG